MSLVYGLAVYGIIWWVVLFAVLPWGNRTYGEVGDVILGQAESAPAKPRLLIKVLATSAIAFIVWSGFYVLMVYKPFALEDIPSFVTFTGRYD